LPQFHYNGKLLSTEILLRVDGRAEEIDDYFVALDFNDLTNFKI